MALSPGTWLGPYEILSALGAGGMGEVYRARDAKLEREIAIKILPDQFARDEDRLARFRREAQVLASLNHPNIACIYGVEDSGPAPALVLELVEGPTLADRLARRMPAAEAMAIARHVAAGLEAAHEKGIVHRDLKPANVKTTVDGAVKILDFGIAKFSGRPATEAVTVTGTELGTTVGTPAYMSPEQLRGGPVDKRTDIWAFGCLLYELLTGRRAFAGETVPDTIAGVVGKAPNWDALPADVPGSVRTLLRRCLEKDPSHRLHDIADARLELDDALATGETAAAGPTRRAGRERLWWLAALGLGAAAVVVIWMAPRRDVPPANAIEFGLRFPPAHYIGGGLAVSPDGRFIVTRLASTSSRLWLTALDSAESKPIAGTEQGAQPFWSPDGSQIAFFRGDKLSRMAPTGGPIHDICDAPTGTGTWNEEGVILFAAGQRLMRVPASGGTPAALTLAVEPNTILASPQFLPDGRHFLFQTRSGATSTWRIGSLDSDRVVDVLTTAGLVHFVRPYYLLFVRGSSLVAQSLDLTTFRLDGREQAVVSNILPGALSLTPLFAASETVLIARTPFFGERGQLTWLDRNGARLTSIPSPAEGEYLNPSISPNGSEVAVNAVEPQSGNWDVWIWNQDRGFARRLTNDPAIDGDAVWSSDGRHVVFTSHRGGRLGFYRRPADGSGEDELLAAIDAPASPSSSLLLGDWSSDRQYLVYALEYSLWALPLSGQPASVRITDRRFVSFNPRLSPDGRWLAFNDNSTGKLEVHVRPFMRDGALVQISHGGGIHPRWIANGGGVTFTKLDGGIVAVDLELSGASVGVGAERLVTPLPVLMIGDSRAHYDVTRDGRRFLVRQPAGPAGPPATVLVNWRTRLR